MTSSAPVRSLAFFGPFGTFTEQAVHTQADLRDLELVECRSVPDVLDAVSTGAADAGIVPIENSIEGMVNFTLDSLAFDHDLLITRDVVLDIEHCLLGMAGVDLAQITELHSIPVATAQCHRFIRERLPQTEIVAATSTAAAAQHVAQLAQPHVAAIAPQVAAQRYGLAVLLSGIEDHPGNQTRFVVVERERIPSPTGNDRTAIVVYQRADEPGSLMSILQEFAARRINLSNLSSRPIKAGGLGDYCFIIFAEGHVHDDLLADALRALHAKQGGVKFFGSYPTADPADHTAREHADSRWRTADDWMTGLQARIDD